MLEVIVAFERATGMKIPYEFTDRRPGDVVEAWADPSLAEELLGWRTSRGLEEMLADSWNWQRKPAGLSISNFCCNRPISPAGDYCIGDHFKVYTIAQFNT